MSMDKLRYFIEKSNVTDSHFQESVNKLKDCISQSGIKLEILDFGSDYILLIPRFFEANELWLKSRVDEIQQKVQEFKYFSNGLLTLKLSVDEDRTFVPFVGYGILFAKDSQALRNASPAAYSKIIKAVGL